MSKKQQDSKPKVSYPTTDWKQSDFFTECDLTRKDLSDLDLDWRELTAIYDDHCSRTQSLNGAGNGVFDGIRHHPAVHSVRMRVKDPTHLIRKIVRKRSEDPQRVIGFSNYREEITDLIGIRALHLFKDDWLHIDAYVRENWSLAETPIAYIRKGDNEEWQDLYAKNCDVKEHPKSYRSVHYLVETSPTKETFVVELQVRTLMEEAWSEVDHTINYPTPSDFETVQFCIAIFNRLAGSADELASLINILETKHRAEQKANAKLSQERDEALRKLEEVVAELELTEQQKESVEAELKKIKRTSKRTGQSISASISTTSAIDRLSAAIDSGSMFSVAPTGSITLDYGVCETCGEEIVDPPSVTRFGLGQRQCNKCAISQISTLGILGRKCARCGKQISTSMLGITDKEYCTACEHLMDG